jgi:L-rhamnose mutarotase
VKTWCLALDLKDDHELIAEYRRWHHLDNIWPEVAANIHCSGILNEQIFLLGTRMVMVLQTNDDFTLERKAEIDRSNRHMQEWERLMDQYQQKLPQARPGEKWVPMEKIFEI